MTPIAPLITDFLREYLPVERGYSPHTCDSYAHAFRLLFAFAAERLGTRPSGLHLEHLDAQLVLAFLGHIEIQRSVTAATPQRPAGGREGLHALRRVPPSGCA